jgi:hypothetical protein
LSRFSAVETVALLRTVREGAITPAVVICSHGAKAIDKQSRIDRLGLIRKLDDEEGGGEGMGCGGIGWRVRGRVGSR